MSLLTGCQIYFDPGDDDHDGGGWVDAGPVLDGGPGCDPGYNPEADLRNPQTGLCEYYGDPVPCDPYNTSPPAPPFGQCDSHCNYYDETTCLIVPGCHAAYTHDAAGTRNFVGCWENSRFDTPPNIPCEGLDSWSCSSRSDCVALHESIVCSAEDPAIPPCPAYGQFLACQTEPQQTICDSDDDCSTGEHCNLTDYCVLPPECYLDPNMPCPPFCMGLCEPDDVDQGSCYGDVFCDSIPPACPPNSLPGISNGCWTGACIPVEQCEPQPVDCSTLDTEAACTAQQGCVAVYGGVDCECGPNGCQCRDWVFESCIPEPRPR